MNFENMLRENNSNTDHILYDFNDMKCPDDITWQEGEIECDCYYMWVIKYSGFIFVAC